MVTHKLIKKEKMKNNLIIIITKLNNFSLVFYSAFQPVCLWDPR